MFEAPLSFLHLFHHALAATYDTEISDRRLPELGSVQLAHLELMVSVPVICSLR
jgi:hypothetical protein